MSDWEFEHRPAGPAEQMGTVVSIQVAPHLFELHRIADDTVDSREALAEHVNRVLQIGSNPSCGK